MIYKVTFHISTLYICQISSTQKLTYSSGYENKEGKFIHEFILYTRNFLHEMESKYCIMGSINQNKQ